jgi:molybdopterin/thiamine biosynthesis adenylyltransferase
MFFSESDAREKANKAEVLAKRLKTLNGNLDLEVYPKRIQNLPEEFIPSYDIVFGCLDNVQTRLHVNAFCYHYKVPYIDGGTEGFSGRVQVIISPDTPCLECNINRTHMKELEKRNSCTGSELNFYQESHPQEITTTSIIAALMVREGLKIISKNENVLTNRILYYNGVNNITEEIEMEINPDCQHHTFV